VKTRVKETTFFNYRKVMNRHVLPRFGNSPIDSITSLDIETFISKLKCGSKTKQNILTPFRLVMKFAKKTQNHSVESVCRCGPNQENQEQAEATAQP
jgi:hypothetical protein